MATSRTTRPPTSHIAPFGVRMQPDLKERLEKSAHDAGRSLNAEIVARLEASFQIESGLSVFDKEFLLGLVSTMKSLRSQEETTDLAVRNPDGTTMLIEMKRAPRQYEFSQHEDEADAGPPRRKVKQKKT